MFIIISVCIHSDLKGRSYTLKSYAYPMSFVYYDYGIVQIIRINTYIHVQYMSTQ